MRANWTINEVNLCKKKVYEFLDSIDKDVTSSARSETIISKINQLSRVGAPEYQLEQFIYIMWALITHYSKPFLKPGQINSLIKNAFVILKVNHIKARHSSTSILYNELQTAASQIHMKEGRAWQAAWTLNLAREYSGMPLYSPPHEAFSQAIRFFAIDNYCIGIKYLKEALATSPSGHEYEKSLIHLFRAYRITGDFAAFKALLAAETCDKSDEHFSDKFRLELEWEKQIVDATESSDFINLLKLCRRGQDHCRNSYLLEGFFWQWCVYPKRKVLPKLRSLQQYPGIDFSHDRNLYKIASAIEDSDDARITKYDRIEKLGQAFEIVSILNSSDKRLLAYFAISQRLLRMQADHFYEISHHAYRSLSLVISSGCSSDLLKLESQGA